MNLKPCPFCGDKSELVEWEVGQRKYYAVRCKCDVMMGELSTAQGWMKKEDAIKTWNKREEGPFCFEKKCRQPKFEIINEEAMSWKQFLTEQVLKGCWHEITQNGTICHCSCGVDFGVFSAEMIKHINRTFTNRNDLMDLYEQIEKDGKLISFLNYLNAACDWKDFDPIRDRALEYLFKWLFCLDGSGYKEKCKMVAECYGWREGGRQ